MSTAIRLRGVVKRFGALTAVDGLDLDVPVGTCIGLLGPNGAGKSTTMKALTAQVIVDEGEIEILGYRLPGDSKQARAAMGVVPQLDNLDVSLTVEQNLLVFSHLYRVKAARRKDAIERALGIANLTPRRDSKVDELSGGMRRRLLIARALLHEPQLLLLDEPTVGPRPAGAPGAVGAHRPAALRGRLDPDEHALHRGGRAALRRGDDHVARQGRRRRPAARSSSPSTRGPRRSRSTVRRRGSPRSRASPATAAGAPAAPAPRSRSCRPTAPPTTSTASAA